jgi:hypothetical protein
MKRVLMTIIVTAIFAAFGKSAYSADSKIPSPCCPRPDSSNSGPTKEQAVLILRDLLAALEANDYDKAMTFLQVPPTARPDELRKQVARLLELKEISKRGIDILAMEGRWGKLDQAFDGQRAKRFAERAGVPLDSSYGLTLRNAEAGFYWDGKRFKIIRCDDIGKLG